MDNFCYASTESKDGDHIPQIRRAAIHGIHSYFPLLEVPGHVDGKQPVSKKNRDLGDGKFVSLKEMIGFLFDGIKRTVQLPHAKALAYIKETHQIFHRKSVPLKDL